MSQTRIRLKRVKSHVPPPPKNDEFKDEQQFRELFSRLEAENLAPDNPDYVASLFPKKNPPLPPAPKSDKVSEKIWEGLGWLGLIVVALLLYAATGAVNPFFLIIGFSFLVLAPAAYYLAKKDREKPSAPLAANQKAPERAKASKSGQNTAGESSTDSPAVIALKVGGLSALYFCVALVAAAVLAVIMAALAAFLR